jgi:hypothetical protein
MEQHPIPQNISSYQFRLVGDMTLKQFFQLAGGLLIAFIFYSLPVQGIIKWPLAVISAVLGVALAFLPLEERPLEKWIFAFFRAIYSPTEFLWKKTVAPAKFFQDEAPATTPTAADTALNNYLASAKQTPAPLTKLENDEKGFMSKISGIFTGFKSPTAPVNQPTLPLPVGTITVDNSLPNTIQSSVDTTSFDETRELVIPQSAPVKVAQPGSPHLVVEEHTPQIPITTNTVAPIIAGNEMISTKQAIFSVNAAPPSPPVAANVVVGQAVNEDKKIIEGAIMEIRDSSGRPIRALRSNKLGHFVTVTPLDNGKYEIVTEKDGYEFAPVSFEATGVNIPPILVTGKRNATELPLPNQIVETYTPALSPNFQ